MNQRLDDLVRIIHFTENVSAKIHGLLDEAEIFRTVKKEFAQSKRYTASILLLTDRGLKLKVVGAALASKKLRLGEKAAGVRLRNYKIDLKKSSIYRQVVQKGRTVQVNVSDIIGELFPQPLAYLISKVMGYEKSPCILTPLKRQAKIIGAFAISSTDLAEYFIPSVQNFARHISNALELADEIKQRKETEESLRQLVESQKDFIAQVSHELRMPLAVIKAVVEAGLDGHPLSVEQSGRINKRVDQITQILQSLMLLSRLDIGQEPIRETKFNLDDLLKEISGDVLQQARREGFEPKIQLRGPKKIKLRGDLAKISSLLTNLIQNAVVHSSGKPRISLKVEKQRSHFKIIVEDNNQPVPAEEHQKIFERFYRGQKGRGKGSGLGLGLFIAKRLVEYLKGKIWLEAKGGRGNRFVVQLPLSS